MEFEHDRVLGSGGRRNKKLAIPRSLSVKDVTRQRRKARRTERMRKQIFRAVMVAVPLSLALVGTENMRQRALRHHLSDVEFKLLNQTRAYENQTFAHSEALERDDLLKRYPFSNIADVTLPLSLNANDKDKHGSQTGLFWQIPRTGATTLKDIMADCLHLVQASRTSAAFCDVETKDLHVCRTRNGAFVNCDTSDDKGIQRCRDLDLIASGLSDVIVSSRFVHAASLFDEGEGHLARAFTIMRDPIERMASTFYYLREAKGEREHSESLFNITLTEYAKRADTPSNWMVRSLTGRMTKAKLDKGDLDFAKKILEQKMFVLLTTEMESSVDLLIRHQRYKLSTEGKTCITEHLEEHEKSGTLNSYPMLEPEGEAYLALKEANELDVELYEHAVKLFTRQFTKDGDGSDPFKKPSR